jgi:hypothetical protein
MLVFTALAAEPTGTLTLACEGTVTVSTSVTGKPDRDEAPEATSMGLILNLTERTVSGLVFPVTIDIIDDEHMQFSGSEGGWRTSGFVEWVTGDTEINSMVVTKTFATSYRYSLKCKPTQRMF